MQRGLGEIGRRNGLLSNDNLDAARTRDSLGFDSRLAAPKQDEQTSLGPCILDRDSYQLLDQLGKDHLTGECLRSFDYSLNVQLGDRLATRSRRGRGSFLAQARVTFVELLHLADGAPTVVAVARVAEIKIACGFDTARQVVLRNQFVGEAFVLNEPILARQMDSILVKTQGVGVSLFKSGKLGRYKRVLVRERGRVDFGPLAQLFTMRR